MGILAWLFGGKAQLGVVANLPGPGTFSLEVVGESKYQAALEEICGGRTESGHRKVVQATLFHEDSNAHDSKAVRVDIGGMTVGYLGRENARQYRRRLAGLGHRGITATCSAIVVGGWDRGNGDTGHFGVKLDLPVVD